MNKAIIIFLLGIMACKSAPEYFIGKWQMLHVIDNNDSIDLVNNWMHIKEGGTFESYDGALKKNESGKWSYHRKDERLFIDGNGDEGDSEWTLSLKSDTLFFFSTTSDLYLISRKYKE